ncbi:MAG: hypothetical protein ACI8P3_003762, partial [Saprospiraceae bacterium]
RNEDFPWQSQEKFSSEEGDRFAYDLLIDLRSCEVAS